MHLPRNVVQLNHSHRFSVFSLCGFLCIIQSFMLPAFSCIVSFLCCMDSPRMFSKYEDHPAAFTSVIVHFVSNTWQVLESKRAVCVSCCLCFTMESYPNSRPVSPSQLTQRSSTWTLLASWVVSVTMRMLVLTSALGKEHSNTLSSESMLLAGVGSSQVSILIIVSFKASKLTAP